MGKPTRLKNMGIILLMEHYLGEFAHMFEFNGSVAQCYSEELGLVLLYRPNTTDTPQRVELWMAINPQGSIAPLSTTLGGGLLASSNEWNQVATADLANPDGKDDIIKRVRWLTKIYPALKTLAENPPEEWLQ